MAEDSRSLIRIGFLGYEYEDHSIDTEDLHKFVFGLKRIIKVKSDLSDMIKPRISARYSGGFRDGSVLVDIIIIVDTAATILAISDSGTFRRIIEISGCISAARRILNYFKNISDVTPPLRKRREPTFDRNSEIEIIESHNGVAVGGKKFRTIYIPSEDVAMIRENNFVDGIKKMLSPLKKRGADAINIGNTDVEFSKNDLEYCDWIDWLNRRLHTSAKD